MLTQKGVPFEDIDVADDPTLRQEIAQRSGQRTVPQIFIGEESIGGFMELRALEVSGELDEMLAD